MNDNQEGLRRSPGGEPEWMRWFDELADLPAAVRADRLSGLAREQPELAGRLARMFDAEETTSQILSGPVFEQAPELVAAAFSGDAPEAPREELAPGTQIGPYRLVHLLGRGGMGEVYCAERADGVFEQRVALKVVKRGMDTDEILRRFRRERQILARLEHPGIARILDGGTVPDGRPYFVLELVDGEPILAHCRRVGSSLEERLRLMIAACEAVDAAHRNLVVHRDLKPSNLLVTAEGQVKLLDFGIAKLLEEEPGHLVTQHERQLMTPGYAAPEQLLGEPVTTATDVYALGVILYELLTGRFPYPRSRPFVTQETGEDRETIKRPSAVLRRDPTDVLEDLAGIPDRRRFARRIQGDLDTVVLAALRRDPARRYRSAADLAADLRRFLEGRPIQARADSVLYRGRKLVLRHKLAAAALTVAVLSLVVGLAVALRQAENARAQARRAERVKELLISIFREADPQQGQGPALTAREILDTGARRVETELGTEPEVQAELLDSIAQIQRSLGLFDPARSTAEAALAGRRKLFGADSAEAALSRTTLAEVVAGRGRLQEALQLAEQARPVIERRFGAESPEVQRLTRLRAVLLNELGEPEKALALAQGMAEAARRRFGPDNVETARRLVTVGAILGDLSRFAEAERMVREGLGVLETSPEATRTERADARRKLAELVLVQGRQQESVTHFAAALDLQRAALGPKHAEVAFTLIPYGYVLSELRRYREAEQALREAIRILEPLDHYEIGTARKYLGFCLIGEERYAEAEGQFAELVQFLTARVGPDHPSVWGALMTQGIANLRLGRLDPAENQLSRVVVHFETTLPGGDGDRSALKHLAEVRRLQGRPAEALDMHRRALEMEHKLFGTAVHPGVAFSHYQIALDLLDLGLAGSLREARTEIDQAIAMLSQVDAGHPFIDRFLVASGRIALAAGDRARARQDLAKAVERLRGHRGANDAATREAEALLRRTY